MLFLSGAFALAFDKERCDRRLSMSDSPPKTLSGQSSAVPSLRLRILRMLKRLGLGIAAFVLLVVLVLAPARPLPGPYLVHAPAPALSIEDFLAKKLEVSRQEGVLPGNEERLEKYSSGKAPVAILYLHGFGASRAEGEAVVDVLAKELSANVYYARLPGHGGAKDAHAAARYEEYFERIEEAFHYTRPLGEKMVLMASSTGALLSLWLASRHPEDVHALVLASPLCKLADPTAFLLSRSVGMPLIEALYGKERDASWKNDPEQRKQPGYEDHWITRQYFRSLLVLEDLRRTIATEEILSNVKAPVLSMYYYADSKHQDRVVSVHAMHTCFGMLNGGHPHSLSREVAIADGNHILMSSYVRTDKEKILAESRKFLAEAMRKE